MGWFSTLFSSIDSSQRARKGQALSSTHDAFSLPTSSPVFGSHPDAFNPHTLNTPDIDPATPQSSYTYPPRPMQQGQYGYIPSPITASRPGSSSILPTHMDSLHGPLSPRGAYPFLEHTWDRLRVWLNREYPELGDTLNYGILPQDLADIEMQLGLFLPPAVRESYLIVNGQEAESAAGCSEGLFFGLTLLPLESVLEEWRFWREVDEDTTTGANPRLLELMQSIPPRWIRLEYSNRGWIPLIADKAGNYVGIDMNPAEAGAIGQVIIFGRDFDTKVVLWNGDGPGGWGKWLAAFVDELESNEGFEIGYGDNSEGSEDDVGYESYYHDGSGHGAGDGGGDSGAAGGLRLIGEYRGWSVLEAWGDKSLRKWHEAGLLPQYEVEPAESIPENVGLGMDLAFDHAAEIPIPVISERESSQIASTSSHATQTDVPTISVTRPPAPRPVDLPTQQDISPSPPEPLNPSAEFDLESGRGHGMQPFQDEIALANSSSGRAGNLPVTSQRESYDSSPSAIPSSPPPPLDTSEASLSSLPELSSSTTPTATVIPDIMAELTPPIATIPIQPSTSNLAQPNGVSLFDISDDELDSTVAEPSADAASAPNPNGVEPAAETADVESKANSHTKTKSASKKHDRSKSSAGSLAVGESSATA